MPIREENTIDKAARYIGVTAFGITMLADMLLLLPVSQKYPPTNPEDPLGNDNPVLFMTFGVGLVVTILSVLMYYRPNCYLPSFCKTQQTPNTNEQSQLTTTLLSSHESRDVENQPTAKKYRLCPSLA